MINIVKRNGKKVPLDISKIRKTLEKAAEGIDGVDILEIERDSHIVFTEGMTTSDIQRTLKQTVNDKIRVESPNYTYLGARLELQDMYKEAGKYAKYRTWREVVTKATEQNLYSNTLREYDLDLLDTFIDPDMDKLFTYYGIVTYRDRYAIYDLDGDLLELPQHAMMRVAAAVASCETERGWLGDELITKVRTINPMLSDREVYKHCWAITFYQTLSAFEFSGSTPIWSNAGTPYGMLIACFVGTVADTLEGRTRTDHNFAISSSYGGGVGDDLTDIRANGGKLRNFKAGANGLIPMIKTMQGYAMQYNQAGTRSGSHAVSIVPYHLDLLDFIELKKQSGSEARRVKGKGIYPELFFPDLFFKRLLAGETWTLFDPQDVPDLNEVWGDEFEKRYEAYEKKKSIRRAEYDAYELFKKIIIELDATGAPFILFRDNFNRRNPQAHDGIIKSSQLCVVPETRILTKNGYKEIIDLVGTKQTIWNGFEWSEDVEIVKTGENQQVIKVLTNYDVVIECTTYHKFYVSVDGQTVEKRANELISGDKIIPFSTYSYGLATLVEISDMEIIEVVDEGRISDTYCFTEPKRHMGVFNGILAGNCTEIGVVSKPSKFLGWEVDENNVSTEKWQLGKTNICCLASLNLGRLKTIEDIGRVTMIATRFLDNVITINKYVTPETERAGKEDRNIGLGVMSEMEALAQREIYFGSLDHEKYIDETYEAINYYTTKASNLLAKERGTYKTYQGSSWSKGILTPELGTDIKLSNEGRFKWDDLRADVLKDGMRNANLEAVAPTGTISTLFGATPCIEPSYRRRYLEEARNGDMIAVTAPNISINNYQQYQPAEEVSQKKVIKMAAVRQKWISQSQSVNLFKPIDGDFDDLMELYILAWKLGLKSTYYLKNRSKVSGASSQEVKESAIGCAGCD